MPGSRTLPEDESKRLLVGYGIPVSPEGEVLWNFEKFLVARDGQVVARFRSSVAPESKPLLEAIERELAKP